MLKEEIKIIKESRKDLRKFGISVGLVLLIISTMLFYFDKPFFIYLFAAGTFLFITGLLFPSALKPLNKIWMILAIVLGYFMSRVILVILYYLVLTPIGLLAKIFGKKFLTLKFKENKNSYWERRNGNIKSKIDYERQF